MISNALPEGRTTSSPAFLWITFVVYRFRTRHRAATCGLAG